jgi:hypothetical protein
MPELERFAPISIDSHPPVRTCDPCVLLRGYGVFIVKGGMVARSLYKIRQPMAPGDSILFGMSDSGLTVCFGDNWGFG